ncbi:UDP-2,3-diacylglucosamine diphosphatase [Alteromonadaceae bacterium M269]|nr:UDP-2,3-diacylglucosamine diphosphatase [Alteromonadaceae bacterium M269]
MSAITHYRTVCLSDIHLGSKDCKAEYLLNFLDHCQMDTLYLIGDIVDMWAMSKQFRWPKSHNQLFHRLLNLPQHGTRVIYLPGNHDEPAQKYSGMMFGDVEIYREYTHVTADGRKLLLLHGDQFDQEVCFEPLKTWFGDQLYTFVLFLNRWYNACRLKLGFDYWSLASFLKSKVKGANDVIARYRRATCHKAAQNGFDGVICGHIHHPEITEVDGTQYYNDGDWVENCSALTEDMDGKFSLVYWTTIQTNENTDQSSLIPFPESKDNKAA